MFTIQWLIHVYIYTRIYLNRDIVSYLCTLTQRLSTQSAGLSAPFITMAREFVEAVNCLSDDEADASQTPLFGEVDAMGFLVKSSSQEADSLEQDVMRDAQEAKLAAAAAMTDDGVEKTSAENSSSSAAGSNPESSAKAPSSPAQAGTPSEQTLVEPPPESTTGAEREAAPADEPHQPPVELVQCLKCGELKDPADCCRKSKKFLCKPCNSAASMLSKACQADFSSMSPAKQRDFWRQAAGCSKQELVALYKSEIQATQSQEKASGSRGEFHPLTYWSQQGYDAEAIRTRSPPENIRQHPVLGEVYAVDLDFKENKHMQQVQEKKTARVEADHGEAKDKEDTVAVPKAKAKIRAKTPAQIEKQKLAQEKRNSKLWVQASQIAAVLAPLIAQHKKVMEEHANETDDNWVDAQNKWAQIQKTLTLAKGVVRKYEQSPSADLEADHLEKLAAVRQLAKYFQMRIRYLCPRGQKRKAAAAE